MKLTILDRILIICARKSSKLIQECSQDQLNITRMEGSAVLIATILAFASGGAVTYTQSESVIMALGVGGLMGVIMFIVDGLILSYSRNAPWHVKLFRVVMSTAFSLVISTFLMITLFQRDVATQLHENDAARTADIEARYADKINVVRDRLTLPQAYLKAKEEEYINETDGTAGSGKVGIGDIATVKQAARDSARVVYNTILLEVNDEISRLEERRDTEIDELSAPAGLLDQLICLHELRHWISWVLMISLHLWLLCIDLTPLFLKDARKKEGSQLYEKIADQENREIEMARLMNAGKAMDALASEGAVNYDARIEMAHANREVTLRAVKTKLIQETKQQLFDALATYKQDMDYLRSCDLSEALHNEYVAFFEQQLRELLNSEESKNAETKESDIDINADILNSILS